MNENRPTRAQLKSLAESYGAKDIPLVLSVLFHAPDIESARNNIEQLKRNQPTYFYGRTKRRAA